MAIGVAAVAVTIASTSELGAGAAGSIAGAFMATGVTVGTVVAISIGVSSGVAGSFEHATPKESTNASKSVGIRFVYRPLSSRSPTLMILSELSNENEIITTDGPPSSNAISPITIIVISAVEVSYSSVAARHLPTRATTSLVRILGASNVASLLPVANALA